MGDSQWYFVNFLTLFFFVRPARFILGHHHSSSPPQQQQQQPATILINWYDFATTDPLVQNVNKNVMQHFFFDQLISKD